MTVLQEEVERILSDGKVRTTGDMLAALADRDVVTTGRALIGFAKKELAMYAKRGPEEVRRRYVGRGKFIMRKERPWRWGLWGKVNDEYEGRVCPHCGGIL